MQLIRGWMWGLLARESAPGGEDRMDRGDEAEVVRGVSRLLAEILAKLEAGLRGTPLDVEISYEMEDDVRTHFRSTHKLECCLAVQLLSALLVSERFMQPSVWVSQGSGSGEQQVQQAVHTLDDICMASLLFPFGCFFQHYASLLLDLALVLAALTRGPCALCLNGQFVCGFSSSYLTNSFVARRRACLEATRKSILRWMLIWRPRCRPISWTSACERSAAA